MTRTAVLVLNHDGRAHLEACLASLGAMDVFVPRQPGRPRSGDHGDEVWLVDNGSTDGSVELVRTAFPWVKVMELEENLGFSAAYNKAVEACDAETVALLNNDMRVAPDWLTELHAARARHRDAAAIASRIMSWDGRKIDFAGADTFFIGHALQRDLGSEPSPGGDDEDERLLFGCAGALLLPRATFLDLGGFDPDYFSFSEDVDLGWRAAALGRETWLTPRAVAYHKLHASWQRLPSVRVRALVERNALCNVIKSYETERGGVFLLASVALTFLRGWAWTTGLENAGRGRLSADGVAHLAALRSFAKLAPVMRARRKLLAGRRAVGDDALLPLFGRFADPPLPPCERYRELFRATVDALGLDRAPPLPSWPEPFSRESEELAVCLAERCGAALGGWAAAERYAEEAARPTWEYLVPDTADRLLTELREVCRELIEGGFEPAAVAGVAARLERLAGVRPAAAVTEVQREETIEPAPEARHRPAEPTLSVVVRTRDRLELLERALSSVVAQSRPPLELVVVNDGGADPGDRLRAAAAPFPIRLLHVAHPGGRCRAAQIGLEAARGRLVTFLDDDDELLPRHHELLVGAIVSQGAIASHGDVDCVTAGGADGSVTHRVLGGELDPSLLLFESTTPLMAVVLDRTQALAVGGFDPEVEYFEDWDLLLRLARHGAFTHVDEVVATYHTRPEGGLDGLHRYTYLARIVDRHRDHLRGRDWASFYAQRLEPARRHAAELSERLAAAEARLAEAEARWAAVESSRYWRTYQWLRRLLGRT